MKKIDISNIRPKKYKTKPKFKNQKSCTLKLYSDGLDNLIQKINKRSSNEKN